NPFLEQEIDIREYLRVLYERRWLIISITLIICTLSLMRSFMLKPVYQATTRILIEREGPKVVKMDEVAPVSFAGREYYQTQYKILKSHAVAEKVDKALGDYKPWSEWTGRRIRKKEKPLSDEDRISALLNRIEIKPIPNTQLVEISADDVDPAFSAKIANLWAAAYIEYILDAKYDATKYASGWLQGKIKEAKKNLEIAEANLQQCRRENNIIAPESENIEVLSDLLKRKSELEIELTEKLEYLKEKHPEVIGLKSELASVNSKITGETNTEILSKDKEIQYNILKREVESNKQIYESLLKRIKEMEVTGELKTTNVRVIDKATIPKTPARPKKKINLLIALFMGLFGGSGLAFLFENLDQSVKTPEDIKNYIKLPALASIAIPREEDEIAIQPEMITSKKPRSTISEAYRSLRTSIMFTAVEHKRKSLIFTSSGPQEGKTTSAINLAIVMAQAGEKTILLDADLRQPKIEKNFNITSEHGMTEVLAGTEELDKVIRKTEIPNLEIITCGSLPPNPSELLGSKKMDDLLEELEKRYDRVIIDTPPVLAVTDAVVLSGKVDGTIVVVRAGETNRNAVLKTKEILTTVHSSNLIGVVLNMVETTKSGGHYYYYHYYGKKYGHYGEKSAKEKEEVKA
ncbi:MAG: polysaccharide biosynthesis tyrosine autokinase, partial [Candidatus Omnitrophota bacterium]